MLNALSKKPKNPFCPGSGHTPPYLAGRSAQQEEFVRLLEQDVILENLLLTALRGVGKTVLLEAFKPLAFMNGWLWVGTDFAESASVTEESLALRLLTDLAMVTHSMSISLGIRSKPGLSHDLQFERASLNFGALKAIYDAAPGLVIDKLKNVFETVWPQVRAMSSRGIVFVYDEANNLSDHPETDQYPLAMLLDLFQSLQRKKMRFLLVLSGLPAISSKIVESRTYASRMFRIMSLESLSEVDTVEAIVKPLEGAPFPLEMLKSQAHDIWKITRGYPYFIQYFCRELWDVWAQAAQRGQSLPALPLEEIVRKLDGSFFAGQWVKASDRQRQLLEIIAEIPGSDSQFSTQDVVQHPANKASSKPFSSSHVNQILAALSSLGLVHKNRFGKYLLAIPLLNDFIRRQAQ